MDRDVDATSLTKRPFYFRDGLIWQLFGCPVVVNEKHKYDGLEPYAGFLHRCGYSSYADMDDVNPEDIFSFVQAHTYFNLCQYIASIFGKPFQLIDLIRTTEDLDYITLSGMTRFLVDNYYHVQRELVADPGYGLAEKRGKMMDAITSSVHTLQWFLEVMQYRGTGSVPRWSLEYCSFATEIYMSSLILGEHLEGLHIALRGDDPSFRAPRDWPDASYMVFSNLVANGWCPREVQTFGLMRLPATVVAHLCHVKSPRLSQDHSKCTLEFCPYETVTNDTYCTQHTPTCRGCEDVVLEDEQVHLITGCFEEGCQPIVSFSFHQNDDASFKASLNVSKLRIGKEISNFPSSDQKIEVARPYDSTRVKTETEPLHYIAISHVWSDGLGNPHRNALPTCQIMRLQKLVDAMDGQHQKPTSFWIDSLCIPHDRRYRKKAIANMFDIYASASSVLVLDASLYDISAHLWSSHPEELLIRILVCPWNRRLWTYQEGKSAARLVFQFFGGGLSLQQILLRIAATHFTSESGAMFSSLAEVEGGGVYSLDVILMRGLKFLSADLCAMYDPRSQPHLISEAARAVHLRRTSRPGDEALCFSALVQKSPEIALGSA